MRKHFRRMLGSLTLFAASLTGGTWIYTQHPKFGKLPDGARLDKIKRSPSYSGDGFKNLIPTPVLADDRSFVSVGISYLFSKKDRPVPPLPIPSVKTDLQSLDRNRDVFVWLDIRRTSFNLEASAFCLIRCSALLPDQFHI